MREGIEERIFPNNTIFLPYTNYYLEVGAPNADLQKCSYCDKYFATSPPLGWHRRVAPGPSCRRTSAREWSGDLGARSGVKVVHFIEQSWGEMWWWLLIYLPEGQALSEGRWAQSPGRARASWFEDSDCHEILLGKPSLKQICNPDCVLNMLCLDFVHTYWGTFFFFLMFYIF